MGIEHTTRLCTLEAAVGKVEACPEDACPFWEPGGAALEGRCVLERVGPELEDRPELAEVLLELRRRLESARTEADASDARRAFAHALNLEEPD